MDPREENRPVVRAGDADGLGRVYSESGSLISRPGEDILRIAEGWEINVRSPWRTILPQTIFSGFGGKASSKLYLTTERIVLVRDIDVWKEIKGELTPLGLPAAKAKETHLHNLKARGARQYCEIWPQELSLVKKKVGRTSWLDCRLLGKDRKQYAVTIWKTDGLDPETLNLIQSQFKE